MEGSGFRVFSSHCVTVSKDHSKNDKCCGYSWTILYPHLKKNSGLTSVQLIVVSAWLEDWALMLFLMTKTE